MKLHSRRDLLVRTGQGFGALALASMIEAGTASASVVNPLAPKAPPLPARAKSVISLFMHGGVSHVDTFDPKPELAKRKDGQTISADMAKAEDESNRLCQSAGAREPLEIQPYGQSGGWKSRICIRGLHLKPMKSHSFVPVMEMPSTTRPACICAIQAHSFREGRVLVRGSRMVWVRRTRISPHLW